MKHLVALCLKILISLELANCLKIDPRLERIDRFLEQVYKMRSLRGLESPLQENVNPFNDGDVAKMNEIDSSKYDNEWTQNLESNYGVESKYEELELEIDSEEKSNKATEKIRKQPLKFKPKSKLKDDDDEEESDDNDEKQPEMVPIPHPIPVVVPKLIPMPIIIQHTFPFPMFPFPISLPNIQMDGLMNTNTNDQHTGNAHETRRFMPNAHHRQPYVGF
ncbi:uncharacterized protein LOC100679256 [Nasonia vitripennis]|uniref:Uncharacterized protein n=1 Tax=Nasonia vitripennis TaxID=7425 RepID=A0A7M7GBV7_NASVI|nr:uncharacterized protein LOC100679256 [Nasonia vitripennis]